MSFTTILFITGCFIIRQVIGSHGLTLRTHTPAAFQAPSPNIITSNVLPLTRAVGKGSQSGAILYALRNNCPIPRYGAANLTSVEGNEFIASARFGNQELELVVDTGSADTWVAAAGFTCMDIYDFLEFPESWCGFGTLYESNSSTTFVPIPDENIWVRYGDGRWGVGNFGFEEVTIAGVTVNQQVGVANLTGWTSDYPYSGLIGLAYAGLTNAYPGESDENDSNANIIHYDPIFTSMYKQNVVPPIFSIALNRGNGVDGGYLALGGLPPVAFIPEFASTPIQILNVDHITGATNNTAHQFYLFEVDGLVYHNGSQTLADSAPWKKTENGTGFQTIIDSGTTLMYFPSAIANTINSLFNPPPMYYSGTPYLDCNATAPTLGVKIGGRVFYINPEDMVYDPGDVNCQSSIVATDDFFVLGDPFMRNVVSVFDVGANEMRFAAREYY